MHLQLKELGITKTELNERYSRLDALCSSEYNEFKIAISSASADSSYSETSGYKNAVTKYDDCRNSVMQGVKR